MTLNDMVAGTDEMLLRTLCAAYGVSRERDLDLNDPGHAAILMMGALRFAVAIAKANYGDPEWMAQIIRTLFEKQSIAVNRPDDPGVRRWIETFRQTWGPNVPYAFSLREEQQPLH